MVSPYSTMLLILLKKQVCSRLRRHNLCFHSQCSFFRLSKCIKTNDCPNHKPLLAGTLIGIFYLKAIYRQQKARNAMFQAFSDTLEIRNFKAQVSVTPDTTGTFQLNQFFPAFLVQVGKSGSYRKIPNLNSSRFR